ncbi:flavin reductase-like, FMN-binding [Caballeronia sordidicola]|uniref:Flavin reductase-like, FMN-binding n=1 Tax=Caballeronia sordidicola TaxID=196367 RepID=A0A158GFC4_CABSO|nr:flavin reductase family protein [Caballeronia sordidicola]SAL30329.1 flavin reductase-like, FMN-binding [Caballeronia sordidicola]
MPTDLDANEVSMLAFRDAMAHLGAAVHVITTDGASGRAGFTASAVCSVTDTPPSVLVCVNRTSSAYAATIANGVLCINTLSAEQHGISAAFSSKQPMAARFEHGEWIERHERAPRLAHAMVSIDCKTVSRIPVGTHDILVCKVIELQTNTQPGVLIYYNREYHRLTHT